VNRRSLSYGTAGASAHREHDRRKARREDRVLRRHPRLGTLLLAVQDAPQPERRWAHGARGEELVAEALEKRCRPEVVALHDRRLPGTRANIDHLVVAPSGVWAVDAKRYRGKIRVAKPLFGAAKLTVGGRDRTKLVEGLAKQVAAVEAAVAELAPGTPVHGAFCFVDGELPLVGTPEIKGFPLLHRRLLAKRLNADGPLDSAAVSALVAALADRFPPA
jgi:Nuclease-related domain